MNEPADVHCPVVEMSTRSKLSCLSWNKYTKNHIASSDYEGIVTVWDITTRQVEIFSPLLLIWIKSLYAQLWTCVHNFLTTLWFWVCSLRFFFFQSVMEYEEHEKRAWSVDFSRTEPSMLVSGSDDCKVSQTWKLWESEHCVILTLMLKIDCNLFYWSHRWGVKGE